MKGRRPDGKKARQFLEAALGGTQLVVQRQVRDQRDEMDQHPGGTSPREAEECGQGSEHEEPPGRHRSEHGRGAYRVTI